MFVPARMQVSAPAQVGPTMVRHAPTPTAPILKPPVSAEEAGLVREMFTSGFNHNMYDRMGKDQQRVTKYAKAIAEAVPGKVVLDLGTGRDALLAQFCALAGAKLVFAVEVIPEMAARARETIARAGLEEQVKIIEGHSAVVQLPKVDMVVHEIVGGLAPEEGMGAVLRDLQNRPEVVDSMSTGWSLPRYVETRIVPVACSDLPPHSLVTPRIAGHPVRHHVNRVQRMTEAPDASSFLGHLQVLDWIDADSPVKLYQEKTIRWRIDRHAMLLGFAAAPVLFLDEKHVVDAWLGGTSWQHKLIGLEYPAEVAPGDEVSITVNVNMNRYPVRYQFLVQHMPCP